jgi:hypothetical protein
MNAARAVSSRLGSAPLRGVGEPIRHGMASPAPQCRSVSFFLRRLLIEREKEKEKEMVVPVRGFNWTGESGLVPIGIGAPGAATCVGAFNPCPWRRDAVPAARPRQRRGIEMER